MPATGHTQAESTQTCLSVHTCICMPKDTHKDTKPPNSVKLEHCGGVPSVRTLAEVTPALAQQDPSSERPRSWAVIPPQSHCLPCLRGPWGPSFLPRSVVQLWCRWWGAAWVVPRPRSLALLTAARGAPHPPLGRLRWQHRVRERGEETPQESLQCQLPFLQGQGQG